MKHTNRIPPRFLPGLIAAAALLLPAATSRAADVSAPAPAAPAGWTKPAWLTDLSLGVKESYDDNVYLSGVAPGIAIAPDGGVLAQKNQSSWLTTVSPKVGFNFAPLLGNQSVLKALILSYAGDYVLYQDAATESHNDHRIGTEVRGQTGDFSFRLVNAFTAIEGAKFGPSYPAGLNAYNTSILRERREQEQDRSTITLKYDQAHWFVRPTAALLFYNLDTAQLPAATYKGYQNYSSRYDVNGGLDFGYKVEKNLAVTLGYRDGAQYQQAFPLAVDKYAQSASSDYQRVLAGLEGQPFSWLDIKIQGGPDFRRYAATAPVNDDNLTTYYGEAQVTATLSAHDLLGFNYRQWQWVSSIGEVPYFDSTYDLSYKHIFNQKLSGSLGARLLSSDYTSGDVLSGAVADPAKATKTRDDLMYTFSAGVQYAFTANLSAQLGYAYDLGRNAQPGISDAGRVFNHQLISLGVTFAF
jgi:hypothetical protein